MPPPTPSHYRETPHRRTRTIQPACGLQRNKQGIQERQSRTRLLINTPIASSPLSCMYTWLLKDPPAPNQSSIDLVSLKSFCTQSIAQCWTVAGPPSPDSPRELILLIWGPEPSFQGPTGGWEQRSGQSLQPCEPLVSPHAGPDWDGPRGRQP